MGLLLPGQKRLPPDVVWKGCLTLTGYQPWEADQRYDHFTHAKSVSWKDASDGDVMVLTGYAKSRHLRGPKALLFELGRLGEEDEDTDLQDYSRYFIVREGLRVALHMQPTNVDDWTPEDFADRKSSIDFVIDKGLVAPNHDDVDQVINLLSAGHRNGVSPISNSN